MGGCEHEQIIIIIINIIIITIIIIIIMIAIIFHYTSFICFRNTLIWNT